MVIARKARNGQRKEAGVRVRRIDDIFRGGSPLVLKRKQLDEEYVLVERKRAKGE